MRMFPLLIYRNKSDFDMQWAGHSAVHVACDERTRITSFRDVELQEGGNVLLGIQSDGRPLVRSEYIGCFEIYYTLIGYVFFLF